MEQKQGARFVVQFSGYHENGSKTEKKFEILHFDHYEAETLDLKTIQIKLENKGHLSPFRRNREIEIYQLQAF